MKRQKGDLKAGHLSPLVPHIFLNKSFFAFFVRLNTGGINGENDGISRLYASKDSINKPNDSLPTIKSKSHKEIKQLLAVWFYNYKIY